MPMGSMHEPPLRLGAPFVAGTVRRGVGLSDSPCCMLVDLKRAHQLVLYVTIVKLYLVDSR